MFRAKTEKGVIGFYGGVRWWDMDGDDNEVEWTGNGYKQESMKLPY